MTPQEALAQALHDFGRGCICPGPEQHMNVAALTLDALPEGWEVRTSSHSITEREIRSLHDAAWMRTGAQQERERLLERVEAEWYNGNVTESAYARILDPRPPSRRPGGRPNVCRTCGYHWLTDVADPVGDHE